MQLSLYWGLIGILVSLVVRVHTFSTLLSPRLVPTDAGSHGGGNLRRLRLSLSSHGEMEALGSSEAVTSNSIDSLGQVSSDFQDAWRKALRGKLGELKKQVPDDSTPWESPVASNVQEMKAVFVQFSEFFLEPTLTIFGSKETRQNNFIEIDFQLGFTYPLPWRPRVAIPGTLELKVDTSNNMITSVKETWTTSPIELLRKQVLPRGWDLWHIFQTPVPEIAPTTTVCRVGRVFFTELPPAVVCDVSRLAPAKLPGPPLTVIPSRTVFGKLRTSRPNRDIFYCTLPVETISDTLLVDGEKYKKSTWRMTVPSQVHEAVWETAMTGASMELPADKSEPSTSNDAVTTAAATTTVESKLLQSAQPPQPPHPSQLTQQQDCDDVKVESDFRVGSESASGDLGNINVMRRVKDGALRGYAIDTAMRAAFMQTETWDLRYWLQPRRIVAQVQIKGEVDSVAITAAVAEIRVALTDSKVTAALAATKTAAAHPSSSPSFSLIPCSDSSVNPSSNQQPLLGLQMFGTKIGFSPRGEPAIAIYEIQYDKRITAVTMQVAVMSSLSERE